MYISDIVLDNYRSYDNQVVHLEPGICLLLGPNGQGKTNFVEAIGYLGSFHSHRANQDAALVRFDADSEGIAKAAVIRVRAYRKTREILIDLEILAGKANRARLARNQVPNKEVRGIVKSVLFAPEDLAIIKGDPASRRRFIDDFLMLRQPYLAGVISQHQKILKQRGALLKDISKKQRQHQPINLELSTLQVWNAQLIEAASELISERNKLLRKLAKPLENAYLKLIDKSDEGQCSQKLSVHYQVGFSRAVQDWADPTVVRKELETAVEELKHEEFNRGVNLIGAHRDELVFFLDNLPVKGFASHGETWSTALALRLAQFELLCDAGDPPILILDDVFAELDSSRRQALIEVMNRAEQVFITAAVAEDVPEGLNPIVLRVEKTAAGTVITRADSACTTTAETTDEPVDGTENSADE